MLKIIYEEIVQKCEQLTCTEFVYYWEIWGMLWYPWTLEMNGQYPYFSVNDISAKDLGKSCDVGLIELIEETPNTVLGDAFDK